ncbi:cytochrome P450 [Xylariales sp. PMI_506]|nr:cytochrome P450 [Xylariales sp. PMI_506]
MEKKAFSISCFFFSFFWFLAIGFRHGLYYEPRGHVAAFLYEGIQVRRRFRQMKAQGIPLLEHSALLGHIHIMGRIASLYPNDAHRTYGLIHLAQHWREFFPNEKECPGIIYLDIWPLQEPMAMVVDPAMCQDLVVDRNQDRHFQGKFLIKAIAGTRNLSFWDGAEHRLWRSRLNPGFSLRNIQSHMPAIIDEVVTFVDNLKATASDDGSWGKVFPILPRAIDLTFDIIGRVVLDLHLDEQNNGPTELQSALRKLGRHVIFKNMLNFPKRMSPRYQFEEWSCNRKMRKILMPHIKSQIGGEQSATQKTVVQLAMKEYANETQNDRGSGSSGRSKKASSSEFIEDVLGLVKQFLFAGHDTTAIAISWCFHHLSRDPAALARLRAEHDEVFGADPGVTAAALRESPQLLNSLPYTLAVVKEVLRMSPIAATLRKGSRGFSLADARGRQYPTDGFAVVTGTAAMHYHPDLWPRASEFWPERWLGPQDGFVPGQWRPFEHGPLNCIGQELALTELKMVLVFTAREIDVMPAWDEWDALQGNVEGPKPTVNGVRAYRTVRGLAPPKDGLPVRVRLRSPKVVAK